MFDVQPVLDWLQQQFDAILAALNPMNWIVSAAEQLAVYLPDPSPFVDTIATSIDDAVLLVGPFIGYFDYFINVPVLLAAVVFMLGVEITLGVFRVWRMARSLIT